MKKYTEMNHEELLALKKELDKKKIGEILGLEREKSLKYLKENL